MKRLFGFLLVMVSGPAAAASAQGGAAELGWGLGGILVGVAALLIAVGALFVFIRLAKLLEELEEHFKRK
ncbi:MAG: hypothetical protein ACE5LD_04475 [Candidatus Bipolaricaulia bacterium]